MIVDTTVFIDLLRGNPDAQRFFLQTTHDLSICRVSVMELIDGLKQKSDIVLLYKQLRALQVDIVELSEEISKRAGTIHETHHHAHGIGIANALIAATAIERDDELISHNAKHFSPIDGLHVLVPYE